MPYRYFHILCAALFLLSLCAAPAAFAEESNHSDTTVTAVAKNKKTSKKTNAKKKSSAKSKKKSSAQKKAERYDRKQNKKSTKSSEKIAFSSDQIEEYKNMPFETWESPTDVSQLGLPIEPGYAQPYPYDNLMRQFNGSNCKHRGHDIGVVGEKNNGMGSVINALAPAVITFIGKTGDDVSEFGKFDKRPGNTNRTGKSYPRQILAPGYGLVYTSSRTYGRWRSGNVLVMRITQGPLEGYTLRYMHMAAIRPDLKIGDSVHPGEHVALMGLTAIMESWPHVHIDLESPNGKRADLAPFIGIPQHGKSCKNTPKTKKSKPTKSKNSKHNSKKSKSAKSKNTKTASAIRISARPRSGYIRPTLTDSPQTRTLIRS